MLRTIVRLVVALLTFAIGVSASAVWALFSPSQMPASAVRAPVLTLETPKRSGCRTRSFLAAPPPPPMPTVPMKNSVLIFGGVLNDKAISKPQPAYPPIAKAARVSGVVSVRVEVDVLSGGVVSANAGSGHPLLQQAAVAAARQARISPTLYSGKPVIVSGVLTYNFVLQ